MRITDYINRVVTDHTCSGTPDNMRNTGVKPYS